MAKWRQAMITFWAVEKKRTWYGSVTQTFLEALIIWNRKIPNSAVKERWTRTTPQSLDYYCLLVKRHVHFKFQLVKLQEASL